MILKRSIRKEVIHELPKAVFNGNIHVIQTEEEAEKAIRFLMCQSMVGIDTETRPSFTKGQTHKVALLQISTDDCCFLFRLNAIGLPSGLIQLLESTKVLKIGLSLQDDFMMLRKRSALSPAGIIELQQYVRSFGIEDMSLQKIYANLFGEKISKSQRLSNWEIDVLSDAQKMYAATDAWACLRIYNFLESLRINQDFELEPVAEPDTEESQLTNHHQPL